RHLQLYFLPRPVDQLAARPVRAPLPGVPPVGGRLLPVPDHQGPGSAQMDVIGIGEPGALATGEIIRTIIMATVAEITPEHELQRSLKKRQILAIGLVWGALVVLIFHFWFNAKERESFGEGLFILLQVLGYPVFAASIAIAVLLFFGKGGAGEPEQ